LIKKYPSLTKREVAHLLGQCSQESMNFLRVRENLNYNAAGLFSMFKSHFSTLASAEAYAHNPEKIGNYVYANREGNGDEQSGDGYRNRGVGYIGLTFKNNIEAFCKFAGIPLDTDPDKIASNYSLEVAHYFFHVNHIYPLCVDVSEAAVANVTRKINKGPLGEIGFDHRLANTKLYDTLINP
jgi:putative chitinase